jgi:hypothetical protein
VTVTNAGILPVSIRLARTTGPQHQDFLIADDQCTETQLAPSQSCKIEVRFAPSVIGPESAKLEVTDDTRTVRQEIPLTGSGT